MACFLTTAVISPVEQMLKMHLMLSCGSQELCLQTKLLAPPSCKVAEFLSKAPQPPPAHAIKNALQILKVAPSQRCIYFITQTEMLYTGLRNIEVYRHNEELLDVSSK